MSYGVVDYGWSSAENTCAFGYLAPQIIEILNTLKVRRLCDIGSGNGALAAALHQTGFYVAGVEYDAKGVGISRSNYPQIPFYNLGVQDNPKAIMDAEGSAFDAVISTEVIEHLYSPHHLPIFARKLLHPGGYLIISTPYHGYLKNLALSVFNKWDRHHTPLWHGGHIKFWSRNTLTQLLDENGFKVIDFHGAGRLPWLWKSMILEAKAL